MQWLSTRTRRLGRWVRRAAKWGPRLAYYHAHRLLPRDPNLALYAAYWFNGYSCNPAAIYEKARELVPAVRGVWVVRPERRGTVPAGVESVDDDSLAYYRLLARATYFINNVNFPDFVVKRRGSVHVQTHHGTPVKVMGAAMAPYSTSLNVPAIARRCRRWDFSISANAHTTQAWAKAYPGRYETLEYGYPRNDRLALAQPEDVTAARVALGLEPGQTIVLYAPTQRGKGRGYRPLLDVERFAESLGPDHIVLIRAHYFYGPTGPVHHPRVRDVSARPCVEEIMLAADILVTDYSSIMFDYAVLDRPIVLYTPDWDWYQRTRGVVFDVVADPPGVVAMTQPELVDAFLSGAATAELAAKHRDGFRRRFSYLDDGHAAERVVRKVFGLSPADPTVGQPSGATVPRPTSAVRPMSVPR